jgi:hypothetical protein
MPAIFIASHALAGYNSLSVTIGSCNVDKSIIRHQTINLPHGSTVVQNVLKHVKKKNLIKLAVLSLVGDEILKPRYIELHAICWNSQIIAHLFAVAALPVMKRNPDTRR